MDELSDVDQDNNGADRIPSHTTTHTLHMNTTEELQEGSRQGPPVST